MFKKGSCHFLAKECALYWLIDESTKFAQEKCGQVTDWLRLTDLNSVFWAKPITES